jgi:N-acetylmuramoyl-L-alanine amidase
VLEVDNLSDYEAFLLPNPYRLIVDIHGKDNHGKDNHGEDGNMARARQLKDAEVETADVEAPPRAGSNPGSPQDVPKSNTQKNVEKSVEKNNVEKNAPKNVPPPELKADMKALAGKPVSKSEQIHAQHSVASVANDQPESSKADPPAEPLKPVAAGDKTAPTTVKKVIVEADADDNDNEDDDTPPVKVAKLEGPTGHSHAVPSIATASHKADTASESDSAAPEDKVASDPATAASGRGKSLSRLSASRKTTDPGIREARPTASGDRSLIRALGLKIGRIVIDPGHGGHDTGTIGPDGLQEKDLVLEVGRRLGKLLETRLGAEVVYTRKDDTFIPLETRTAIANQQRADLFISIHANSSHDAAARGVETYYLNFTSSPEALEVAARENAVSEKSIYELQDLVKKIALKEKIEESREFAGDVEESLHSGLAAKSPAIRDRGVKKAPFIVLIGANMPSILAEISFVSNPTDEHRLETSEYRQRIAESLYRGIAKYVDGLSGVKVASKMDKAAGQ